MDLATLQRANKISDKIRDLERVLDHFQRQLKQADSVQDISEALRLVINDYINRCNNLGTSEIRNYLTRQMIEHCINVLSTDLNAIKEEFEKL